MIEIKEEDIELEKISVNPSNHPTNIYRLEIGIKHIWDKIQAEQLKQQILQNQKLRKEIVDLADIWDGKESERYGKQLLKILNDLGIKDIPEFYSEENIDKFIKKLDQDRKEEDRTDGDRELGRFY